MLGRPFYTRFVHKSSIVLRAYKSTKQDKRFQLCRAFLWTEIESPHSQRSAGWPAMIARTPSRLVMSFLTPYETCANVGCHGQRSGAQDANPRNGAGTPDAVRPSPAPIHRRKIRSMKRNRNRITCLPNFIRRPLSCVLSESVDSRIQSADSQLQCLPDVLRGVPWLWAYPY